MDVQRTCERRNWIMPQLVLALPRDPTPISADHNITQKKAPLKEVIWHNLYNLHKTRQVVGWVAKQLASKVHRVYSADLISWTRFSHPVTGLTKPKLRVLLVSDTSQAPILLSAIALRFRDRIDVGLIHPEVAHQATSLLTKGNLDRSTSTYLILTPGTLSSNSCAVYMYGKERGEALNFRRLEIFLKFRVPEGHDLFTLSLTLVNLLLCIELFIMELSCCAKHVMSWLRRVAKYNTVLVALWLTGAVLVQFKCQWVNWLANQALLVVVQGYFCNSYFGHLLIAHWSFISSLRTLAISVFFFGCAVGLFSWRCIGPVPPHRTHERQSRRASRFPLDSPARPLLPEAPYPRHRTRLSWMERRNQHSVVLINQFLWPLQPMALQTLSQQSYTSMSTAHNNIEENFSYCHLAALDYIKNLPSWRFTYDSSITARLVELTEAYSDEKYETLLLNYTKFPAGMIPSMVCSICLERYRAASTTQEKRRGKLMSNSKAGNKLSHEGTTASSFQLCRQKCADIDIGDTLCGLPCGHNFHAHCVQAWLSRDEHASCPICRWPCYKQKEQSPENSPDSCGEWDLGSPV